MPMAATKANAMEGDGVDTSSFNEDLSYNQQTKFDLLEAGSGGKVPRIPQNLAMLHNVSVHDDTAYISGDGLKELSVVESDNSDQGMDTPAAYLKAPMKHGGFHE